MAETPSYIKSLLHNNGKKPAGRKAWGIDLETTWLPFFTATNVMGETAIPSEALGSPLRLALASDGSVKFSKSGRPSFKVAKELADSVKMVRENFATSLILYSNGVAHDMPDKYKEEVARVIEAGEPIIARDSERLELAIAKIKGEELAEAIKQAEKTVKARVKKEAVVVTA